MSRAMLLFERQADASWLPTTVILATPKRLEGKCLPGNADRDTRLDQYLNHALPPRKQGSKERGTFEDWIGWAVDHLGNGHSTWAVEVKSEVAVEALYQREVLRVAGIASVESANADDPRPALGGQS